MSEFDKYKPADDLDKCQSLGAYLEEGERSDLSNEKFNKVITVKVTEETHEMWLKLCKNWGDVLGYDNKSKIFEFAIVESLNVPIESLGGFNNQSYDFENETKL